ncbi:MAG: hypothetical protein AAF610_00415 [Pseudomonadota bacterium]
METYRARQVVAHPVSDLAGLKIKPYTIAAAGREEIDIHRVLEHADAELRSSGLSSLAHHGLGYVIYHAGADANWLLLRVWVDGCIVAGRVVHVVDDQRVEIESPLIECVYEQVPASHERTAWVRHMMGDTPDAAGYLADRLTDGDY